MQWTKYPFSSICVFGHPARYDEKPKTFYLLSNSTTIHLIEDLFLVQSFPYTLFCLLVLIFRPTRILAHQRIFLLQFFLYHSIIITLHQIYTMYTNQSTPAID